MKKNLAANKKFIAMVQFPVRMYGFQALCIRPPLMFQRWYTTGFEWIFQTSFIDSTYCTRKT